MRYKLLILSLCSYGLMTLPAPGTQPVFNSDTSSAAVVFLDFDGHTVDSTAWNYMGPIICDGSGLADAQVLEICSRVAEDYSPFNINITTDSVRYWNAPASQRTRVVITISSSWYGSAGGVSYVGSFHDGVECPCFVFSQLLGFNTKYIAEAVSHEAGHTLGLYHQASYNINCVKTSDYNTGSGSGETGWAPIMGLGYYQNLTQWHNGPNSYGCNVMQSDMAVITGSQNGLVVRADDCDSVFTSAKPLNFSQAGNNQQGKIERNNDADMYSFLVPTAGHVVVMLNPGSAGTSNSGSDLDLQADLYNQAHQLIRHYNDMVKLNVVIDTVLPAAVYYLKIRGTGNSYSSGYGSIGTYSIHGALLAAGALPLEKVTLAQQQLHDKVSLNWDIISDKTVLNTLVEVRRGQAFIYEPVYMSARESRRYDYFFLPQDSLLFFRVRVITGDGQSIISNEIRTVNPAAVKDNLFMEMYGRQLTVKVTEPVKLLMTDLAGRVIFMRQLEAGLSYSAIPAVSSGIYHFIILSENGKADKQFFIGAGW